jgi:hypothetical protein
MNELLISILWLLIWMSTIFTSLTIIIKLFCLMTPGLGKIEVRVNLTYVEIIATAFGWAVIAVFWNT